MPTKTAQTTQSHVNIAQIRNGIVYTRTGELRAVLEITPLNFALKSEADQNVIIGQYQSFINALNFPIQIIVQSRRLDLHPYLKSLEGYATQISNELLRLQAVDYIEFVSKLTSLANVMDKRFYVVVPYNPAPIQKVGVLGKLFAPQKKSVVRFNAQQLQSYLATLKERVTVVTQGLEGMQLAVRQLNTQEVIELFYSVYNPEEAAEERLTKVQELQAPIIQQSKPTVENKATTLNNTLTDANANSTTT